MSQRANDTLIAALFFLCVYILYKRRLLRLPLRPLPSPRTNDERPRFNAVRKCHLHVWLNVSRRRKKKSIQVTMQCCVSSTRGSSQPSRSPPPPRWWDIISEHQDRVLAFFFFFFFPVRIGGEIIGAAAGGPAVKLHPDHFFGKERKMLAHGQCGGWFHYFDGVLRVSPQCFQDLITLPANTPANSLWLR